jgi:hypothetical protein
MRMLRRSMMRRSTKMRMLRRSMTSESSGNLHFQPPKRSQNSFEAPSLLQLTLTA